MAMFIGDDLKGHIIKTASVDTPLKKIPGGKSGLSKVRDSKPKLLDQLRESLRARHYSRRVQGTIGAPGQSTEPI
jgi:hypothetical protein